MRYFAILVALAGGLLGATVPGRYIVELSIEPVIEHVAKQSRRAAIRSEAATAHRARVRSQQREMRARFSSNAVVLDAVDTVANAMFVQMTEAEAKQTASADGVRRVIPVRTLHRVLDRAATLDGIVDAWNRLPADSAGAGVKIGIIDTGIDANHPGFQDPALSVPEGFPKISSESDRAYTNSKVIVARSYVNMLPRRDTDRSAQDRVGHGTALAMIAAGVRNAGPLATITGVAPKAWIGNYKVFGTPGVNDTTTDDAVLKALDDAVADGMDILNLSLGSDLAPRLEHDPQVAAIERATKAGVIVVVAAGNNGPQSGTIGSPATAPSAIAVGASRNDRAFAATAAVASIGIFIAINAAGSRTTAAASGTLFDAGLACEALPSDVRAGGIALILRGTCTFEEKLNNAQRAGAAGALVYAAEAAPEPFAMSVGSATLPAQMISFQSGTAARRGVGSQAIMRFALSAVATDSNRLASFSATGPNVDASIKPDLVAVGSDVYVATQKLDSRGDMYDASGYLLVDGTSFSAPIVTGAAALLKSARPGLAVDQYRSLLINNTSALPAAIQHAGSGRLNLGAALQGTATAFPTAINFGSGNGNPDSTRTLTITNVSGATEAYSVLIEGAGPLPSVSTSTFQLAPGASIDVPVMWRATSLAEGAYEGFVRIAGSAGNEMRIPWWYGATSGHPAGITILDRVSSGRRSGSLRDAVLFRIVDAAGLPVITDDVQVLAMSGDGDVQAVRSRDGDIPGLYSVQVRLGPMAGPNVFRIQAGQATADLTITGN